MIEEMKKRLEDLGGKVEVIADGKWEHWVRATWETRVFDHAIEIFEKLVAQADLHSVDISYLAYEKTYSILANWFPR